jgi:UDP-glucuronate decarboxylase
MNQLVLLSKFEVESISRRFDFQEFANKKVVITGASGLIGGYLTSTLLLCTKFLGKQAPKIFAVSKSGIFPNLQDLSKDPRLNFCKVNLEVEQVDFDFEILIHAASTASPTKLVSRDSIFNVNTNLLREIRLNPNSVEKVLFISSGEVYGSKAPRHITEAYIGKIDQSTYRANYPEAKLEGEKLTHSLVEVGIEGSIARLFHTFGPGIRADDGRSFADFIYEATSGRPPLLKSSGNQIRSFLYLEDTIVGLFKTLFSNVHGPVNIGSEAGISILEFAKKISCIAGLKGEVQFDFTEKVTKLSPNDVIVPSNSKLSSMGWSQEIDIDLSIERTINWVRSHN